MLNCFLVLYVNIIRRTYGNLNMWEQKAKFSLKGEGGTKNKTSYDYSLFYYYRCG